MRKLYSIFITTLIGFVLVITACVPATGTPLAISPVVNNELEMKLDEYLTRLSDLGFSGSVLIARQGEVLFSKGYGVLDGNPAHPITPDSVFALGSNTKPFTAAAILKLQDQGLLNVHEPLSRYLPDAPEDKAGITLHQLLTHSSGLDHSGFFNGDFDPVTREEAIERILYSELLFSPGAGSSYSDAGFILLAGLVEVVSGKTYQDYVRAEILEPAGMLHTGWWGNDATLKDQLTTPDGELEASMHSLVNLPGPYWAIMGAGGMVSTVNDLFRWQLALQQGKILSPEALQAYATVQVQRDERGGEGYGWVIVNRYDQWVRAHAGGTPQIHHNNVINWFMGDDIFVVASSNSQEIKAEDVTPNLNRIVFAQPYQLPPKKLKLDSSTLDGYVGRYQLAQDGALIITRQADKLLVTGEGQATFNMLFKSDLPIDTPAAQTAVINYLNSGKDAQLEAWKNKVSGRLGTFKQFRVIGTAAPFGSGEPWTYVSFEFENGDALTRWIVSPAGALEAALLETEPPYMVFLAESENEFVPFSLSSQPPIQAITFFTSAAGKPSLKVSLPARQLEALKLDPSG